MTAGHGPHHVQSGDGTSIAYWSSGHGPPMLLVHGAMSDHQRWRITELLDPHRTVHAMDRRGRGGSGDGEVWSLDREVEDVVAVVDALAAEAGTPVDVLGHSLGGLLSLRAAARTQSVRRLVLYEPAIDEAAQPPDLVARMRGALDAGQPEQVVDLMMREVVRMPEEEIATLRAQPSWPTRVAAAPTLPREMSVPLEWNPHEATAVTVPTLLIQGGDSPDFVQRAIRRVDEALPNSRLVALPGQQHVADQMQPDRFAELVLDFLLH